MVTTCEFRRRFRTCGEPGIAICQYCGSTFCARHGGRLADGQEICARSTCQQKKADLERHLVYKEDVVRRNHERLCGEAGCQQRPGGQCSKCGGFFCLSHVENREIEERQGTTSVRVRSSVCGHCFKRRNIWSKR